MDQALDDLRHFVTTKCEEVQDVKDAAKSTLSVFKERVVHYFKMQRKRKLNPSAFEHNMQMLGYEKNSKDGEVVTVQGKQKHVRAWVNKNSTLFGTENAGKYLILRPNPWDDDA